MSVERIETIPSPVLRKLLAEAPVGRHIAQLHRNPETLTHTVCEFVGEGLRRGDAVIVVASARNAERYLHRLREMGLRPDQLRLAGQLVLRDTQDLLARFMRDGMPQWDEFRDTIGSIIQTVQTSDTWKSTRVYGEMVSDLWRAEHTGASIRLEIYWNELARLYQFCLLCCYELGGLDKASYASAHDAIGRTHSHLLPAAH